MTEPQAVSGSFGDLEVTGIGLVVPDVMSAARAYARLLGVGSWQFSDLELRDVRGDGEGRFDGEAALRVGSARIGRLELELVQPLGGRDGHAAFLERHGGGIHHVMLGPIADADERLARVQSGEVGVEWSAAIAGGRSLAYLDTQDALCTRLRLGGAGGDGRGPEPWARHAFEVAGGADLARAELVQLGIVVADVERVARGYTKMFGIDDWNFLEFEPPEVWQGVFHDVPMRGARFHLKAALGWHGAMQIELLEPVAGTSTHMDFLRRHGPGIHHVSFGAVAQHDAAVAALQKAGVGIEMGGQLGGGAWFTYLRTQSTLGTIFELVRSGDDAGRAETARGGTT